VAAERQHKQRVTKMDKLLDLLKVAAPALATAVAGPMGGAAISAIASKLGVPASVIEVTRALETNPDAAIKLREIDVREFEAEQKAVSDRWSSDRASDSWLSKNIRPMTLIYLLTAYLAMALLDGTGFHIAEAYVTLLGQWGMLVMGAYFGGRTLEKITSSRK
jgi:hypothetical protein